jgi:glycosyltransferase involved in cell wall biosynthesis
MIPQKPIRLFVDAHVFDKEFQGTQTFLREIYTLLAQKKDLLLFLAAHHIENLRTNFPASDNIRYVAYKSKSPLMRLSWEIPLLLKRHAIDYAHFQYICPLTKSCKYIVTLHDVIFSEYPEEFSWQYRFIRKILFKRSAGMADIITTVSDYSKKSIRNFLHVDPKVPIHIVPNGVGREFFQPYQKQQSKDRISEKYGMRNFILYVSRIEPRKNHSFLLKAYLGLKLYEQGFHLVLVGHQSIKIPDFDEILEQLPEAIRQFIYLNDRIGNSDLLDFYRAADVFVYPSKAEGFGIPPLEAGAMKIPVICSNCSAMKNYDFFGAYHIDPSDLPAFAGKLATILRTPPTQVTLDQISQVIHDQYSWEQAAEAFYKILSLD